MRRPGDGHEHRGDEARGSGTAAVVRARRRPVSGVRFVIVCGAPCSRVRVLTLTVGRSRDGLEQTKRRSRSAVRHLASDRAPGGGR